MNNLNPFARKSAMKAPVVYSAPKATSKTLQADYLLQKQLYPAPGLTAKYNSDLLELQLYPKSDKVTKQPDPVKTSPLSKISNMFSVKPEHKLISTTSNGVTTLSKKKVFVLKTLFNKAYGMMANFFNKMLSMLGLNKTA